MTWSEWHNRSQELAAKASDELRSGLEEAAIETYTAAANAEQRALEQLSTEKPRTLGITAISATSLWFKARNYAAAESLALKLLDTSDLPEFARHDLRNLLQTIWLQAARDASGIPFLPNKFLVSVSGGEIVTGAAPIDVILNKIQTIQAIFYRTVEQVRELPLRRHGPAPKDIQDSFTPWLFQAPPGSYQFAIALREPDQTSFLDNETEPTEIADKFFHIIQASISNNIEALHTIVPDNGYASTFLKLARNLAPSGRTYENLDILSINDQKTINLNKWTRKAIQSNLRELSGEEVASELAVQISGVLRAVHLDKDWIDIIQDDNQTQHIIDVRDSVDDVIGPMVNKQVKVQATYQDNKYYFKDIELDE